MVFALPKNMAGNGAICPGCDHLLAIPSDEDEALIIGISEAKYGTAIKKERRGDLEKRHRSHSVRGHHEWANAPIDAGEKSLKVMFPIAIISIFLIGGLAFLMLSDSKDSKDIFNNPQFLDHGAVLATIDQTKPVQTKQTPEVYLYDAEDKNKVQQLEKFHKGIYAAKTIDEMLPYVCPVEGIKEKMASYYKGEALTQSPFKKINFAQSIPESPGYLTFECQTQDYNIHYGVLKYTQDEILLDWESYVAYSEMTWDELAEKKPTKPVKLRVTAKLAYYYNDEFANEKDWQSVALTNPNEDGSIYGYVKRGSATYQRLFNFGLSDNRKVILEVYFPEGADTGNQVFIERVVEQGWLVRD